MLEETNSECEDSNQITWKLTLIQSINQNLVPSTNTPILTSIGNIPAPSESQTGIPFQDGFQFLIPQPSPPPSPSASTPSNFIEKPHHHHQILKQPSNPDLHSSGTSISSSKQQNELETTPVIQSQKPSRSNKNKILSKDVKLILQKLPSTGPTTATSTTNNKVVNSAMSRRREPWYNQLKFRFTQQQNRSSPSAEVNYPKIGDSFPSIDAFKEACLWASWSAGHDMHVRNHQKSEGWERCIFTCRYDRSPPKGYNCPFRIVALLDKPRKKKSVTSEEWTVSSCELTHKNHQTIPGIFDPLGKRSYRKRKADGNLEDLSQQNSDSELVPRKKGKQNLTRNVKENLNRLDHNTQSQDQSQDDEDGDEVEVEQENQKAPFGLPINPHLSNVQLNQLTSNAQDSIPRPRRSLAKYEPVPPSLLIDGLH